MNRNFAVTSLALGSLLFALAPPVLKLLTTMGARLGLEAPQAVSFCNVLFVGNACAGLVTLLVAGPKKTFREIPRLSKRTKGLLLAASLLSTIYPALLFTALERTTVINVVLLSRFNGIVFVALAFLLLKTMVRRSEIVGYAVMGVGVTALVVISNGGLRISVGEGLVLLAAVFFALTEIVSRDLLRECSIHTYVFVRNTTSALIFFSAAIVLFGPEHFAEAFRGELWILMLVYAGIAIVAAQVLWLRATRTLPAQMAANFQLVNPAFSIFFAFILLNEIPTAIEWLVIGIVAIGILIPRLVPRRPGDPSRPMALSIDMSLVGR